MTIKDIIQLTNLSNRAFAAHYHIPETTLKNWLASKDKSYHRECSEYVLYLLELVLKHDLGNKKAPV